MKRILICWMLPVLMLPCTALAEDPVYFADANLKFVVESTLGKTDPTPTDMLGLDSSLFADNRGITDLTGLEYATNLLLLSVGGNQITDLSPLAGLSKLQWLWGFHNQITDIGPLSGLTNLWDLNLHDNQVVNISPLAGLANLRELNLWINQISDISPLAGLTKLDSINLDNNQITNIGPLAGMTSLRTLLLEGNQITDMSPVAGLTNLVQLSLSFNQVSDISPLSGLTNLWELDIWKNQITDLSPLAGMNNFGYLVFFDNKITDISPLAGMTNLAGLCLEANALNRDAYCLYLPQIKSSNPLWSRFSFSPNGNPPGGVSASDGVYSDEVQVAWTALCPGPGRTDVFQYMVYRSTSLGGAKEAISAWLSGTSYDDATASPGVHYWYSVKSDMSGEDYSDPDEGWRVSPQRTLTTSSTAGGTVSTPGIGSFQYDDGASVPVVAAAAANYHFVNWTGTAVTAGKVASPSSASTTVTMDANYTLQANFALDQRTLTTSSTAGGSVTTPGEGAFSYPHGTVVAVVAAPEANHHFVNWTGTAVTAGKVADPSAVSTNVTVDADYTLVANFSIDRHTVTVSSTAGGSVSTPGEGSFQYDHGTQVTLQAEPEPLFVFAGWRGSIFANSNPCSITMNGDYEVKAHFESVLDVLYVDDDAPGDPGPDDPNLSDPNENGTAEHPFDTLQEAIEVARDGARVIVRSGTYRETIDLLGKSITVSGLDDDPNDGALADLPIIDAQGKDSVVRCIQGEDPNCILQGLVITGGKAQEAGGILCVVSSPTVLNCLIVGNRATGLHAGGGIHCQDSNAVFVNCTISGNCGGSAGAGVCLSESNAVLLNSIVWENAPTQVRLLGSGGSIVAYTDVAEGWPATANLDVDPCFALPGYWADPADLTKMLPATNLAAVWVGGDYHLLSQAGRWEPLTKAWVIDAATSPCIDAGDPNTPTGKEPLPNGSRINLGAYGGTPQTSKSP